MKFKYLSITSIFFIAISYWFTFSDASSKSGFTITGEIANMPDSTLLMLKNLSEDEYIDSVIVMDGKFVFSGQLKNTPEELRISTHPREWQTVPFYYLDLFMGNENVSIYTDKSVLPQVVQTKGSKINHERTQYLNESNQMRHELTLLTEKWAKAKEDTKALLKEQRNAFIDSMDQWRVNYTLDNFNTYSSLLTYLYYSNDFQLEEVRLRYKALDKELKNSKYGQTIAVQLKYPKPEKGDTYYDFEAFNTELQKTRLSDIESPYILLHFGAKGCYGSHLATDDMKNIQDQYKGEIAFVSYFVNPEQERWLDHIKEKEIDWLTLWQEGDKYAEPYNKYHINGTPTFYIIDTQTKKVVDTWFGFSKGQLEEKLNKIKLLDE
ncbi:MAG: DUF4369 domain-containing protein [Bacteroidota bacterium]